MVKLCGGHRSSSICHSASVSSCASSTTMCANGPASRSGSAAGSPDSSTRAPCRSWTRSIDMRCISESSVSMRWSTTFAISSRSAARVAFAPAPAPRRLRVAEPLPGRVEERQVGDRPGLRVLALQRPDLVDREPGGTPTQVCGYRPQVGHQVGRLHQRPGGVESGEQLLVLGQRPPQRLRWDLLVVVLVDEDRDQLLEDVVAGLVVRGAGHRRERLGPVGGAEPQVPVRSVDLHALGRRLLVQPDRRLDRAHHRRRRLQPRHVEVRLDAGRRTLRDEVPNRAGLHPLLAEAREHVRDVAQVGAVGADDEYAATAVTEPRVGVQQVCGPVQGHDGLAGSGPTIDDEPAAGPGADDGVLVGLDRAEHVPHLRRPAAPEAGDERRLVVEGGRVPLEPVRGEHLVPVVADPATGPAVASAARPGPSGWRAWLRRTARRRASASRRAADGRCCR